MNRPVSEMSLADFWRHAHEKCIPDYLTMSDGAHALSQLRAASRVVPGAHCLNVGVGGGTIERHMHSLGAVVSSLDIEPLALERVADITENRWLSADIGNIPPQSFDVITSCLVVQHIEDDELDRQLCVLLQALKHGGLYAFQFTEAVSPSEWKNDNHANRKRPMRLLCISGAVMRSRGAMLQRIAKHGGVGEIVDDLACRNADTRYLVAHARRADDCTA